MTLSSDDPYERQIPTHSPTTDHSREAGFSEVVDLDRNVDAHSSEHVDHKRFTIALSGDVAGINVDNIEVNTVPTGVTPEPSTLALLRTGILGLAGMARRKVLP